jgi:16S rRNA (cytosine1402-N4)-methyltransferase
MTAPADPTRPMPPDALPPPAPFRHEPVLRTLVVELFATVPPGVVLDATVGGAGHATALLEAYPHLSVLGIDRDPLAVRVASDRLARFGRRAAVVHAGFDQLSSVLTEHMADLAPPIPGTRVPSPATGATTPLSGALFDLGVSSPQLDDGGRGFSYRHDGPLDMRMDTTQQWSAFDVVNGYGEDALAHVIAEHGGERFARRIARAIVAARPVETTAELSAIVRDAIPAATRRTGGHPATRTFQAIRIEVNREMAVLGPAIDDAVDALGPEGRVVVMSYHSGEDRIVKDRLRNAATGGCSCPPGLPCVCDAVRTVRLVRPGAWKATPDEIAANPRAASVRVRAADKLRAAG